MFENQPDALDLFSPQNHLPRDPFKPIPQLPGAENGISTVQRSGPVCSLAVQGWYPVFCLVPFSKDPEHHYLMVTQGLHINIPCILFVSMSCSRVPPLLTPPSPLPGSCHRCTSEALYISLGFFNSFCLFFF